MRALMRRLLAWVRATRDFLRGQPAALLVVLAAALTGVGAGVPTGQTMYTYMWADPDFCATCHVHDYANTAWSRSVHAQLTTCHDCHRVPIRHYPRNLALTLFDRPQTPEDVPSAEVGAVLCEQCHAEEGGHHPLTGPMPAELRPVVPKIDASPLHRVHLDALERAPSRYQGGPDPDAPKPVSAGHVEAAELGERSAIECLDCHGGRDLSVHTFDADARDCVTCHEGITPKDETGAELSCLDCHGSGFLAAGEHEGSAGSAHGGAPAAHPTATAPAAPHP